MKKSAALVIGILSGFLFSVVGITLGNILVATSRGATDKSVAGAAPLVVTILVVSIGWVIGKAVYTKMLTRMNGVSATSKDRLSQDVFRAIREVFKDRMSLWFNVEGEQYIDWLNKKIFLTEEYRSREMFSEVYLSKKIDGTLSKEQYKKDCEAVATELMFNLLNNKLEELKSEENLSEENSYLYKALVNIIEVENLSKNGINNRR